MENSNQYDELLVRYLANDVSNEERTFAESWINASEQNRAYFGEMKKAWELTGVWDSFRKVNIDDKWNRFRETVAAQHLNVVPPPSAEETQETEAPEMPGRTGIRRWFPRVAVAASLLLAVGLVIFFVYRSGKPQAIVEKTVKKDSATLVRHEINTTGKEKRLQLPDGSLIVLAHKSEVTYREPFPGNRHVLLSGKAWFKIAKDTLHPFVVTSGNVATTALGTEFSVTALSQSDSVTVRLYEGKVLVKATGKAGTADKKAFLLPGEEFVYDGENIKVRKFRLQQAATPEQIITEELEQDNPRVVYDDEEGFYMFHNQSLESVLKELSALHNAKIIYNKKDIQHIDFTGRYNRSDSLETILKRIGILNNLTITKTDTAFVISK